MSVDSVYQRLSETPTFSLHEHELNVGCDCHALLILFENSKFARCLLVKIAVCLCGESPKTRDHTVTITRPIPAILVAYHVIKPLPAGTLAQIFIPSANANGSPNRR